MRFPEEHYPTFPVGPGDVILWQLQISGEQVYSYWFDFGKTDVPMDEKQLLAQHQAHDWFGRRVNEGRLDRRQMEDGRLYAWTWHYADRCRGDLIFDMPFNQCECRPNPEVDRILGRSSSADTEV